MYKRSHRSWFGNPLSNPLGVTSIKINKLSAWFMNQSSVDIFLLVHLALIGYSSPLHQIIICNIWYVRGIHFAPGWNVCICAYVCICMIELYWVVYVWLNSTHQSSASGGNYPLWEDLDRLPWAWRRPSTGMAGREVSMSKDSHTINEQVNSGDRVDERSGGEVKLHHMGGH